MLHSRLGVALALLATAACTTHMRTYPEVAPNVALNGAAYRLPMLQYDIAFEDTIISCPQSFAIGGKNYWLGEVGLSRKATAVSSYVAGERFAIDHAALTSIMKTSKYGFESYESGVLKSINTGADDQTGPLIKSVASAALSIYGLANPVTAAGALTSSFDRSAHNLEMSAAKNILVSNIANMTEISPRRLSDKALKKLLPGTETTAAVCQPTVAAALATSNDTDDYDAASAALQQTTAEVDALKLAVASRAASNAEVTKLVDVMIRQSKEMQKVETLKAAADKAKASISITSEKRWIPTPLHWSTELAPDLEKKLDDRAGYFVGKKKVLSWWAGLSRGEQEAVSSDYPALTKAFGLKPGEASDCRGCSDPMPTGRLKKSTASGFAMVGDLAGPQDMSSKDLQTRPDGRIEGLVVREPVLLRLATCTKMPAGVPCNQSNATKVSADILVPQAGSYRLLPFRNGPFEAATLTAKFQETGRLESFSYERTRAPSSGADSLAETLTKVEAFRDKREKEGQEKLTAARAEQLADVTQQITMLTKQKELLALQSPPTPTEEQLIQAETARISAEIALLNAKRSRIEAEALLVAAGGD